MAAPTCWMATRWKSPAIGCVCLASMRRNTINVASVIVSDGIAAPPPNPRSKRRWARAGSNACNATSIVTAGWWPFVGSAIAISMPRWSAKAGRSPIANFPATTSMKNRRRDQPAHRRSGHRVAGEGSACNDAEHDTSRLTLTGERRSGEHAQHRGERGGEDEALRSGIEAGDADGSAGEKWKRDERRGHAHDRVLLQDLAREAQRSAGSRNAGDCGRGR